MTYTTKGNGQTFWNCDVSRCSVCRVLTVMEDSLNPRCRVRKTLSCDCRDSLLLYLQKSLSPQQASFAGQQKTKLCRQAAHIISQTGKVLIVDDEGRIVGSEILLKFYCIVASFRTESQPPRTPL